MDSSEIVVTTRQLLALNHGSQDTTAHVEGGFGLGPSGPANDKNGNQK